MAGELTDKVAVVTGGAAGLGRAAARKFVAEGAHVVIADLQREEGEALASELGPHAIYSHTDVSDREQVADLVTLAVKSFGGLHIMFNNAGISGPMFPRFLDDDLLAFEQVLKVNLLGVMAGTQSAARHMAVNGGGSIINTTSIGGIQAGRNVMTYRASKAAVIQFTKSVAIDLGEHGVRVNALAPGNIPTSLLASSARDYEEGPVRDEFIAGVRRMQSASRPLNHEGTPEDVADAAVFLASDRSKYITGAVLRVDGGTAAGNTTNSAITSQSPRK
ncbi:glucose 1-dehydrogenase [Arthrobacter sp. D1-29]